MKHRQNRLIRRAVAAALLLTAGAFAAPAMAMNCTYNASSGSMNVYQCTTTYVPLPDDILYWADSTGAMQWGGTQFTATCNEYGRFDVALYRWNGRRFEVIGGASGLCLSEY
jgi:hypothetical protein